MPRARKARRSPEAQRWRSLPCDTVPGLAVAPSGHHVTVREDKEGARQMKARRQSRLTIGWRVPNAMPVRVGAARSTLTGRKSNGETG